MVLQPVAITAKELRYRGFTEAMVRDLFDVAVTKGLDAYIDEQEKARAGH